MRSAFRPTRFSRKASSHLLTRPVGRPPNHVRRYYANFSYQAGSWNKKRRVVAKVEWHPGELYPRVGLDPLRGSSVTNLSRPAERVVAFYNQRGTAEQWIKEVARTPSKWTRLSCRKFDHNAVRLQLHALAYNLGNFMRTLALPDSVEQWSLTTLREKLIKIGAKIVRHGRYGHLPDGRGRHPERPLRRQSCAASTGSDRRSLRHDRRHPAHPRRRQDRCIWYAAEESVCPATPANCPLHPMESDYRRPQDASQLQRERFRFTINSPIRCQNGKSRLRSFPNYRRSSLRFLGTLMSSNLSPRRRSLTS